MVSKSDLQKPLASLSKLHQEEVLRYRRAQEEEEIEAIGQENERKGAKWAGEWVQREERKERLRFLHHMEVLENLRRNKVAYFRYLAACLMEYAKDEYIPKKYRIEVDLTDKGIVVKVGKRQGAFAPCGLSKYDLRYCKVMAIKLGNTVAKLEGYRRKSEGGIMLIDEEDTKQYGRTVTNK